MKSAARIVDHPIHPMLIPYPFAFLSSVAVFDAIAAGRADASLATTAAHLRNAGIVAAMAAAVPGLVDYLTTVPDGTPKDTATKHMLSNVTALGCFAAASWANGRGPRAAGRASAATIALEVVGTALLCVGGWLGGTLSYRYQIGVAPGEELTRRERPAIDKPIRGEIPSPA